MTNLQVYKKTLSFSLLNFVVGLFSLALLAGLTTAGFFIANTSFDKAIIGMVVGFVIGVILAVLIDAFISNQIKAAQISMMVKGVTEDNLPEQTFKAGFNEIKGRFGRITAFYFITRAIKGIFHQIARGVNRVATAIGGDVGNSVSSAVNSAIEVLIGYLCDCCLGWVIFRRDENIAKAGCEGAVIFFKHGKTLFRNVGRIYGMGLLSLVVIGGGFFGLSYGIFSMYPGIFESLVNEFAEIAKRGGGELPAFFANTTYVMLVTCGLVGLVMFSMIHSVLVRPFILVGVLRNYMAAGQANIPTEADFKELDNKSPRFQKLHGSF